jgi:hypothetical protein
LFKDQWPLDDVITNLVLFQGREEDVGGRDVGGVEDIA